MSNDPDLLSHLPQTCPDCDGEGGFIEGEFSEGDFVIVDCTACGGSGIQ